MKVMQKIAAVACSTALACSMGAGVAFAAGSNSSTNVPEELVPAESTVAASNNSKYVANSTNTVSYAAPKAKTITTANIRAEVNGYKVTSISKTAFKGCKKIKTVKVNSTKVSAKSVKAAIMNYSYTKKSVKTIKVKNKTMLKAYQKAFKNTGIKVVLL